MSQPDLFSATPPKPQAGTASAQPPRETDRATARRTLRRIGAGTIPGRLLRLYGGNPHGLTDYEAANALGCERTTINAARGTIRRVHPGLVVSLGKRFCRFFPSNQQVNSWGIAPGRSLPDTPPAAGGGEA